MHYLQQMCCYLTVPQDGQKLPTRRAGFVKVASAHQAQCMRHMRWSNNNNGSTSSYTRTPAGSNDITDKKSHVERLRFWLGGTGGSGGLGVGVGSLLEDHLLGLPPAHQETPTQNCKRDRGRASKKGAVSTLHFRRRRKPELYVLLDNLPTRGRDFGTLLREGEGGEGGGTQRMAPPSLLHEHAEAHCHGQPGLFASPQLLRRGIAPKSHWASCRGKKPRRGMKKSPPDGLLFGGGAFAGALLHGLPGPPPVLHLGPLQHQRGFRPRLHHHGSVQVQVLDGDAGALDDQGGVLGYVQTLGMHLFLQKK